MTVCSFLVFPASYFLTHTAPSCTSCFLNPLSEFFAVLTLFAQPSNIFLALVHGNLIFCVLCGLLLLCFYHLLGTFCPRWLDCRHFLPERVSICLSQVYGAMWKYFNWNLGWKFFQYTQMMRLSNFSLSIKNRESDIGVRIWEIREAMD